MIFAFSMKPDLRGVFSTIILLNIIAIPIGLINLGIVKLGFGNANYMYLREPPPVDNILLIGEGFQYILSMEIIGTIIFLFLLIPFKLKFYR